MNAKETDKYLPDTTILYYKLHFSHNVNNCPTGCDYVQFIIFL